MRIGLAAGLLLALASAGAHVLHRLGPPGLSGLAVTNGSTPFAGDRRLLTTVSPNGDGFRDKAIVSFTLDRAASVRMAAVELDAVRSRGRRAHVVWSRAFHLRPGPHHLAWRPASGTPERTYVLQLTVRGAGGARFYGRYGPGTRRVDAPVVRVQGIRAGFRLRSYAAGKSAQVSVASDAPALDFQVFAFRKLGPLGPYDVKTGAIAMTGPVRLDWRLHRSAPHSIRVVTQSDWPSGLYFLRITASDGRAGYAPFIVRPRVFGRRRVAVVLATNTWQAYNFDDADGDGWGDTWYAGGRIASVDLRRPYLDFGVPFRFRDWDLAFITWLNRAGKQVEYLSDDDLERFRTGADLAARYDLVVFPGHEEYVTTHAYDVVQRYRDLGGNLVFLASNNFFRKVRRAGERLVLGPLWRQLDRPESRLVGVQYVGSDAGKRQAAYRVTGAERAPWLFAGTGLRDGDAFGSYGIEIDARTRYSPSTTLVLAAIPDLLGRGRSAEMTYYETPRGAKVFAAGVLNFAASVDQPVVGALLENLWARLSRP